MPQGIVLWYDHYLGHGFIYHDDPEDVRDTRKIFVHHTSIRGDEALQTGDKVTFEKIEGEQGIEATNVVRIEAAEPSTDTPKELRSRLL